MDVVVTVPCTFEFAGKRGLAAWIAEGDAAGDPESGCLWEFRLGMYAGTPDIQPGERVYIVCEGRVRGYSPLVELRQAYGRAYLIRRGGAVAVTIPERVKGFRGWRYRWWELEDEIPFPDWRTP